MGYKKNLVNPSLYRQFANNAVELFNYTMTNLMDSYYDNSLTEATDGSFKAVCLSGIRTEDNSGGGTDLNDARVIDGFLNIVVRPLTAFGSTLPDPLAIDDLESLNAVISLHRSTFTAKSDFEAKDTDVPKFGQILNCYFEDGSISNSDFRGLRFSQPTGEDIDADYKKLATVEVKTTAKNAFEEGGASLLGEEPPLEESTDFASVPIPGLTPSSGGKSTNQRGKRTKPIEYIVIHYSAAIGGKAAVLKNENNKTSYGYHFIVDRDGSFYESTPTDVKVNHALGNRKVYNSNSIGLCICNLGFDRAELTDAVMRLNRKVPAKSTWEQGPFPHGIPTQDDPTLATATASDGFAGPLAEDGKWEPYTNASLFTAARICAAQLKANNLTVDRIVGHSDIQNDKHDPGPAFNMDEFRSMVKENMSTL